MEDLKKILETAELLFRKYGIRSVTMSDIAGQLGISKKTLYQHIINKNDIIEKIVNQYLNSEKQMCEIISATAKDALDEMISISLQVQRNIEDMNPSLLFDLRKYHHSVWLQFEAYRKMFILNLMKTNLERGKKEGLYRHDLNTEVISRIHIGTIHIFTDEELLPPDLFPRPKLHKEFVMYHLNGIISEKGKKVLDEYLIKIKDKKNT